MDQNPSRVIVNISTTNRNIKLGMEVLESPIHELLIDAHIAYIPIIILEI